LILSAGPLFWQNIVQEYCRMTVEQSENAALKLVMVSY
jgi:hypothetical protein